jgi:osmotically-inducible protein OsmY
MSFRNPNRDDRIYREGDRRIERDRGPATSDAYREWREGWDDEYERRSEYERERPHRVNTKSHLGYDASSAVGGAYGEDVNPARETDYDRGTRGRSTTESGEMDVFQRIGDEVSSWFGGDDIWRTGDTRRGPHSGRGPKSYRRSDERIRDDVADRLTDDGHVDASDIEVTVSAAIVTLKGTVDSRATKRRAEDLAESVSGVQDVVNEIRVAPSQNQSA